MSAKNVSMSAFSGVIANAFSPIIIEMMETFLTQFSMEVVSQCEIPEERLVQVWESTCSKNFKGINLEVLIDKAKRKLKADETRQAKMKDSQPCDFINSNGTKCDTAANLIFEGHNYCKKHHKQVTNKHTCAYVKKDSTVCGSRIKSGHAPFAHEGHDYHNQYLCSNHTTIVNKTLERLNNRCSHVSKNGKQCVSSRVDGSDVCKKHSKDEQEKKLAEKKEKTIKDKKSAKEEKLPDITIELNFEIKKKKPHSDLQFVHRKINDCIVFIDMNSGLVCHNPDNKSSTKPSNDQLVAVGVWDSELQTFGKLTEDSAKYAKAHKIKVESADE